MKQAIKIDIISDIVCPWCYIGKRRAEKAFNELTDLYDFTLEYHPFELNTSIPPEGVNQRYYLINKFGSLDHYEHMTSQVTNAAAAEGLKFNFEKQQIVPNTRRIHALIQFSKTLGKHIELVENFFSAYFTDGIDLSKTENIIDIAVAAGIAKQAANLIITDDHSLNLVAEAETHVQQLGIHAVPFYIINNKHGLSGAQPAGVFKRLIEEVGIKALSIDEAE